MTFIYILLNSLTFLQTNYDAYKIIYITNKQIIIITMNIKNKLELTLIIITCILIIVEYISVSYWDIMCETRQLKLTYK